MMSKYTRTFIQGPAIGAVLAILVLILPRGEAQVACSEKLGGDAYCEELLYKGSQCRDGFCSNPFEKGCLHSLLTHEPDNGQALSPLAQRLQSSLGIRACNSEDPLPEAIEKGICVDHAGIFQKSTSSQVDNIYSDYTEVRILSQNWESAFFASWIMQILLSEVLRVPSTIESGTSDAKLNFYSPTNELGYGVYNDFGAIERANQKPGADCTAVLEEEDDTEEAEYASCGHVIPEFWVGGDIQDLFAKQRKGLIQSPEALGAIGQQGLFVTKFTVQEDPTVLNLLGLSGEANRRKLAETFLRPTTWKDYCDLVSPNNCTSPDGVAEHAPTDPADFERMFVEGSYTGHFRATEENDCDANPDTCTGHVADFPCGWISYVKPQMYYHNIALKSSGKEPKSHGYTYSQMVEMYAAANATRSNLMMIWWTPEATYSTYVGTEAEMQRVALPTPTQECVESRIHSATRCDYDEDDPIQQYGNPEGACDEAPQLLQKIVASGFYEATYSSDVNEAKRSPAYDAVKAVKITELEFGNILQRWTKRGVDQYGFDPRMATCLWVRENLDLLEDFIPPSHPRVGQEQNLWESPLFYVAVSFGGLATIMTVITSALTFRRRNGYVMRFSQVEFLFILLLGILMVSVGSVLLAIEPTNASCIANSWLLSVGYTLELVPLIVKVGAINRLMAAAKKMKRIMLTRQQLFGTVALFVAVILLFLSFWTAMDPPQRRGEYHLTEETNDFGESFVKINYFCSSNSDIWRYAAVVWHCILLLCATVLAFQTRNIHLGFNESATLAFMIYSHFFFLMLRVISFLLGGTLSESYMASLRSLVYSVDAIVTLCIYFIPKLLADDQQFFDLTRSRTTTLSDAKGGSRPSMAGLSSSFNAPSNSLVRKNGTDDESSKLRPNADDEPKASRNPRVKFAPDDVLKNNRVSWGGMGLTMVLGDGDDDDDETEQLNHGAKEMPISRPIDVLRDNKDSWGGANISQYIRDDYGDEDDEDEVDEECDEESPSGTSSTEADSVHDTKKSRLPPASLPNQAAPRFGYAASRITAMRDMYTSEEESDGGCSDDDEENPGP